MARKTLNKWLEQVNEGQALTETDQNAAFALYNQMRSRITTQALGYRDGDESAALDSIYQLFKGTRDTIDSFGRQAMFTSDLAWYIINECIRPFMANWHKRKIAGELTNDDDARRDFRRELAHLQVELRNYDRALRLIADGVVPRPVESDAKNDTATQPDAGHSSHHTSVAFEASYYHGNPGADEINQAMFEAELSYIKQRRRTIKTLSEPAAPESTKGAGTEQKQDNSEVNNKDKIVDVTGLAFSGGGIRSMAICLGVTQRLAKQNVLHHFDFLSCVSGGGYLGSFLTSYWHSQGIREIAATDSSFNSATNAIDDSSTDKSIDIGDLPPISDSLAVRHIRNKSRSLLGSGALGQLRFVALLIMGFFSTVVAVLPVLLIVVFFLKLVSDILVSVINYGDGHSSAANLTWWLSNLNVGIGLILVALATIALVANRFKDAKRLREITWLEKIGIGLLLAFLFCLILLAISTIYLKLRAFGLPPLDIFYFFVLLPIILIVVAWICGFTSLFGLTALKLVGVTGPLLMIISIFVINDLTNSLAFTPPVWLLFLGIAAFFWLVIDVNTVSPLRYYGARLRETYLLGRDKSGGVEVAKDVPLSGLCQVTPGKNEHSVHAIAPYPLLNTAANLQTSNEASLRGRNSDFFVFTPHYYGSRLTGYATTSDLENFDKHIDLGTVMAISGAAASAHMGVQKAFKPYSFWLTLLNIRLGYWLANPKFINEKRFTHRWWHRPGAWTLLRELFTYRMDEDRRYINVSDGGHVENLGIYELIRRRCKYIVAIDAEADPYMSLPSLMRVIRYAQIDFNVTINFPYLDDLRPNAAGYTRAHFTLGTIDYGQGETGQLLYIKSSLTGNERDYIAAYKKDNPAFPHQSTLDQFYDEAQFEAYRALGEHMAGDLFDNLFTSSTDAINENPITLAGLFTRLQKHLLPTNDNKS